MAKYIVPGIILILILIGFIKKVPIYDTFVEGAKESLNLIYLIFPFLCSVLIAVELFSMSGLNTYISKFLAPVFNFLGIPSELCELLIIRPLSGNGAIAVLENIYKIYGPDSYIARCASVIVGASETTFYITAIYFTTTKVKKMRYAIFVSLLAGLIGAIAGCFICKFI